MARRLGKIAAVLLLWESPSDPANENLYALLALKPVMTGNVPPAMSCRQTGPPPTHLNPQITKIDADRITTGPGLHLRYLRHLRAG